MKKTWQFIYSSLQANLPTALLYVIESRSSSPGRKGFVMAVNSKGLISGTIGGGIMEVKMIELAKSMLEKDARLSVLKRQYHDKKHDQNQSGMICSGEQTNVIIPLVYDDLTTIQAILDTEDNFSLKFSKEGIMMLPAGVTEYIVNSSNHDFECVVEVKGHCRIHIFGAGHVGKALAQQMRLLKYKVFIYDDRKEAFPLDQDTGESRLIDYEELPGDLDLRSGDVVVIVSFSYRSDKLILQRLHCMSFTYIGMMGSEEKIRSIIKDLTDESILENDLQHIFTPIGLNMYSRSAEEIAVSIAGQIVFEKNKNLPTGRSYIA